MSADAFYAPMSRTHKINLNSARESRDEKYSPTMKGVQSIRWNYIVKFDFAFSLPHIEKESMLFWLIIHDSYEGANVHEVELLNREDGENSTTLIYKIIRSSEEEYLNTEFVVDGHEPHDDEANKQQLLKELELPLKHWGDNIKVTILDRSTSHDTHKEVLRTNTYALGERLGPFIAKYIGTDFDYAQFGASILDEVNDFVNDNKEQEA